jgi:hypothetical protein
MCYNVTRGVNGTTAASASSGDSIQQITAAAQVFAGRTRLRGIILSNVTTTTTTGSVTLQDESGTQFTADSSRQCIFI